MANRFSEIAKHMGAKMDEEVEQVSPDEKDLGQEIPAEMIEKTPPKTAKKTSETIKAETKEIPTTRKTTALPLVFDIAIKEVKERRNIASKIKRSKKITEDDVVIEALELYFKKAENKSCLQSAYEKLKYLE